MENFFKLVVVVSFVFLVACSNNVSNSNNSSITGNAVVDESQENLLINYDFSSGNTEGWGYFEQNGSGEFSVVEEELEVKVNDSGKEDYSVQIYQDGFLLAQGCKYELRFDAMSTIDRSFGVRFQINGGDYHAYSSNNYDLTSEVQTYTLEFEMKEPTDPAPRLALNLGTPKDLETLEAHKVYFDNFSLVLLDDSNKVESSIENKMKQININQLGYPLDYKKIAVFRGEDVDKTFDVVNIETNKVVYTGDIEKEFINKTSGETNYYGDFSNVREKGKYIIKTETLGNSYEFEISNDIYERVDYDILKMLYLQRCGVELTSELAGDYAHPICHNDEATIYGTTTKIDVSGGWHDAGDYGRYVVPGAKTVADLFLAYQSKPDNFGDNLGIPESSNGIADILDEARFELEWMLKMQDSESGGVYHKVTGANFPGTVMPQDETSELIVSPISDAATGDFAAVMAMSYDTFKSIDKDFAEKCLNSSKKAWDYLNKKSTFQGFKNPSGIVTGEYGDSTISDEYLWASVELYKVTYDKKYHTEIKENYSNKSLGLGWADVGIYALYDYLNIDNDKVDSELFNKMKNDLISAADEALKLSKNDGYFISMGEEYPWGSNMTVANKAMLLQMANKIAENSEYIEAARNNINYLFGVNPMSTSYVTGYGTISPVSTHHRPSQSINSTMPGMLVGGPNSNLQDPYAKSVLANEPPAKCYVDNSQSYSCNEITIYWNSPLIYALTNR
ncbi:glycoside hydrolase family 9 protein [Clostridium grantii]|uniref:Endoglucanase n=1 Tax=Clostridium grantii DSM 8605 TaxID=1121316 RepID=A0A1M5VNR2_9CLOT|nr:glycoside hydrolase family 9 protein [Clostridium grantii]SHH76850.1 endoglucanase [Clostridium grantii DSM 8605]